MKGLKKIHIITIIVAFLCVSTLYKIAMAANPQPGSSEDPLVTKSYVDQAISEIAKLIGSSGSGEIISRGEDPEIEILNKKIDKLLEEQNILKDTISVLEARIANPDDPADNKQDSQISQFKVIQMSKGQILLAGSGTEIIVRSGQASAMSNEYGDGISDVTAGTDLKTGMVAERNHLLVCPKDDGRGILAESDNIFIMVKGEYTIE